MSNEPAERSGIKNASDHNQRIVSQPNRLTANRIRAVQSLLSQSHSEKKIDRISDRLANIEAALERTAGAVTSTAATPDAFHPQSACSTPALSGLLKEQLVPHDAYDATAETHSILASRTVDLAVEGTPKAFNPVLAGALVNLKDTLGNPSKHPTKADLSFGVRTSSLANEVQPSPIELREILSRADGE